MSTIETGIWQRIRPEDLDALSHNFDQLSPAQIHRQGSVASAAAKLDFDDRIDQTLSTISGTQLAEMHERLKVLPLKEPSITTPENELPVSGSLTEKRQPKENDTITRKTSDGEWTITIRKGFRCVQRYRQGV